MNYVLDFHWMRIVSYSLVSRHSLIASGAHMFVQTTLHNCLRKKEEKNLQGRHQENPYKCNTI